MSLLVNSDRYSIDSLELGPMENFIYLITDKQTRRAAVVDPAWDVPQILKLAAEKDVVISDILLTHSHHDHINGIEQIQEKFDAQLHLLKAEARFWGHHVDLPTLYHGGDRIKIGETEIDILHTPGHTPGSACYQIDDQLIVGDALFVWGCGRCDLRGGDAEVMFDTLQRMGRELPGNTHILPGHNYADKTTCTMAEQLEGNPFLQFDNKAEFVEYRMHLHDKIRHGPYHAEPRTKK